MAAESTGLFSQVFTNGVSVIIDALSQGNFVLINNGKIERLFHHHMMSLPSGGCSRRTEYKTDPLKDARLICVTLQTHLELLDLSEWPDKIFKAGYGECKCFLKDRVNEVLPITHWVYSAGNLYT